MRTLRLTLLSVALTGLAASSANADIISFRITGGGVFFGLIPFQIAEPVESDDFSLSSPSTASLVSGPGGPDADADDAFTDYSYGAGTLTLALTAFDSNGGTVDGTFVATTLPFSFTVCEGCDTLFDEGTAFDFVIPLGPGTFSGGLAALFHVGAHTLGGSVDFGLEAIDGDPDSVLRSGFDHRGYAELEIVAVAPEPVPLLLALTAGAAWLTNRRRSRRS